MSDTPIMQQLRRRKADTAQLLDDESFNVGAAIGKMARAFDFSCMDQMGFKAVKVCLDSITPDELELALTWRGSSHPATMLQLIFWRKGGHKPFYRAKLFYNQPKQVLPAELQKLVK
jgi:hypothetical protein